MAKQSTALVYIDDTVTGAASDINDDCRGVTLGAIFSVKGKVTAQGVATN